jgi:gamma-glutamylcyclotransferase (GGCT)/AIG2-like uncharacterized protein YtfP
MTRPRRSRERHDLYEHARFERDARDGEGGYPGRMTDPRELLLFVCDASMSGLPEHARLDGARALGPGKTEPTFDLVDLGAQPALVLGGTTAVEGEVYALGPALLAALDVHKGHPLVHKRRRIRLDDGREVEAYTLDADQARGRRRIRSGSYRAHVAPAAAPPRDGAWSRWARGRGR